jgi:hypothetical protein
METSYRVFWFFLLAFGPWSVYKLHFIHSYEAGFLKANLFQSPPYHLQDYSICNNAQLILARYYGNMTDPNE